MSYGKRAAPPGIQLNKCWTYSSLIHAHTHAYYTQMYISVLKRRNSIGEKVE